MDDTPFIDSTGRPIALPSEALQTLTATVRGTLLTRGDSGYDAARTVWNAMIDRHPGLIIRCAGAADVMAGVRFARDHGLLLAVRGGSHNIAGHAVCDDGVMLDLSPMKSVRIDPAARTARVEPGVLLGEFDREAQAFGLATPLGINSTTGVAGLTLGGGFGWLSRAHGLTVDNLLAVDIATADGTLRHASQDENPDLFWAIRGGGGNFGVVTSFEFRLHPVGPQVMAGLIVHPFDRAGVLLRQYRELAAAAPDDLCCWAVMRKAPPLPFLPAEVHGKEILAFALCHAGSLEEGERAAAPFRELGQPIADVVGPHRYADWQTAFDPLLDAGARNYWKSHHLSALSDGAIDAALAYVAKLPSPECEVFLGQLGGAINRVTADATAYPHRDTGFVMNVHTRWRNPADDRLCIGWARDFFAAVAPHANGGVYVNFMPDDEADRLGGAYGKNQARLARIKAAYDPDNLFRINQNIRPARG